MEDLPEVITNEDDIMLLKLIASLNDNSYDKELDYETLMTALDVVYALGAEVVIMFGTSIYINMDEYFNRVPANESLSLAMFQALHHFSKWYLQTNNHDV